MRYVKKTIKINKLDEIVIKIRKLNRKINDIHKLNLIRFNNKFKDINGKRFKW